MICDIERKLQQKGMPASRKKTSTDRYTTSGAADMVKDHDGPHFATQANIAVSRGRFDFAFRFLETIRSVQSAQRGSFVLPEEPLLPARLILDSVQFIE
jgi:hypothetical protein